MFDFEIRTSSLLFLYRISILVTRQDKSIKFITLNVGISYHVDKMDWWSMRSLETQRTLHRLEQFRFRNINTSKFWHSFPICSVSLRVDSSFRMAYPPRWRETRRTHRHCSDDRHRWNMRLTQLHCRLCAESNSIWSRINIL